jgi:type IV pilus biogenesis protein CpaD/CtpE
MVADPRDLIRGRTLGPADGEAASRAVKVYRDPSSEEAEPNVLQLELTSGQ